MPIYFSASTYSGEMTPSSFFKKTEFRAHAKCVKTGKNWRYYRWIP